MAVDDMPSRWTAFDQVCDKPDHIALSAAKSDLGRQLRELAGDAPLALTLTSTVESNPVHLAVRIAGAGGEGQQVRLSRAVLQRGAQARVAPLTLVACAMTAAEPLDEAWRPRRVGGTTPPTVQTLAQHQRVHRLTDADDAIEQALRDGRDVILMGDYGAGKTATATIHACRCRDDEGYGVVWLDLTDPADGPESVLATLLSSARCDRYLVFADSVQANPVAFEAILDCVRWLRKVFGLRVQILATGWPRLVQVWREPFKEFRKVSARNDDMIRGLVADSDVPANLRGQLHKLVRGDVHLAVDAIDFYAHHGRVPTWADLQSEFTRDVDDGECRRALYWFASLGFFGLDAAVSAVPGYLSTRAVAWLAGQGLICLSDGRYSIPSHVRARLALRQALQSWAADARWGPPEELVWEHLRRSGERVIRATLSRLDLVGVSGNQSAPFDTSTRYLARAWDLFEQLGRALVDRCKMDHTWGDNVGAAIFAARALAVMDHDQPWHGVAEFIRHRWRYDQPGVLPAPVGKQSGEFAHYAKVLDAMRQEDAEFPDAPHVRADPADSINEYEFYKMWMLGAFLGFEGTAIHGDPGRLGALIATAEETIDPSGYFYPRRVPSVTARIVVGLCLAGESYHSSEVVRTACDWLRRPVRDGGPFDNGWQSGAGRWETQEATTAVCLTALLRARAPVTTEIDTGLLWLQAREGYWAKADRETDLALVLEAFLFGDEHQRVYQKVLDLLVWAQRQLRGSTLATSELRVERAPFVAAQLASFVWATVRREYRDLLRALIRIDEPDQPAGIAPPPPPQSAQAPPAEDRGAATGDDVVEPLPSLAAWQLALQQLDARLLSHVQSRDNIVRNTGGTPQVRAELERHRDLLQRSRLLAEQVNGHTPRAVLVKLNQIGAEICGRAWPDLDFAGRGEGGAG